MTFRPFSIGPHFSASVDYIKNSAERVTTKFHWSSKGPQSPIYVKDSFPFEATVQVAEQERIESERKRGLENKMKKW